MTVWHPGFARALRAAQTGDNEAFCDLWRMTNPALRRYLRVTAPRVVDDVASATWVRVARNLRQLPGGERDFRASVARIARDEAAMRRRNRPRRPDSLLDPIEVDTIRDAVGAGRAALGRESLTGETAVGLLTRLPDDVAEMVALRVVLGLDSGDTGALVGLRPGSVIVAVHSGLRRTSNLVGASAVRGSGPANPVGSPSPWALDRLLDLGPDGADGPDGPDGQHGLDPALRAVVGALAEPGSPGDLSRLAPALAVLERPRHRCFGLLPVLLLPPLARRLSAARTMLTGKVAAVAVGTAVLSAPAALACSEPAPGARPTVVADAPTRGQTGVLLVDAAAAQAAGATDPAAEPAAIAPRAPAPGPPPRSARPAATRPGPVPPWSTRSPQSNQGTLNTQSSQGTQSSQATQGTQAHRRTAAQPMPQTRPSPPGAAWGQSRRHHHRPWWLVYLLRHA